MEIERKYLITKLSSANNRIYTTMHSETGGMTLNIPDSIPFNFNLNEIVKATYSNDSNLEKHDGIWMFKGYIEKKERTVFEQGDIMTKNTLYEMVLDTSQIKDYSCQALVNLNKEQYEYFKRDDNDHSFRVEFELVQE